MILLRSAGAKMGRPGEASNTASRPRSGSSTSFTSVRPFPFSTSRPQFSHIYNDLFRPDDLLAKVLLTTIASWDSKKAGAVGGLVYYSLQ